MAASGVAITRLGLFTRPVTVHVALVNFHRFFVWPKINSVTPHLDDVPMLESVRGLFDKIWFEHDISVHPSNVTPIRYGASEMLNSRVYQILFVPKLAGDRRIPKLDIGGIGIFGHPVESRPGRHFQRPESCPFANDVVGEFFVQIIPALIEHGIANHRDDVKFGKVH